MTAPEEVVAGPVGGSCLCGAVRFEIDGAVGPFELCHCSRCRKVTGGAFFAGLGVRADDYRLLEGAEWVRRFELPLVEFPPPYRSSFCSRCGSPVPDPDEGAEWFEIPAGLLDGDPGVDPDRHIFVELRAAWHEIADALPQLTREQLIALRFPTGPRSQSRS